LQQALDAENPSVFSGGTVEQPSAPTVDAASGQQRRARHRAVEVIGIHGDVDGEGDGSSADDALGSPSPVADTRGLASVTAMPSASARHRLDLLMQLREVGVPVAINPRAEARSIYQAVEDVLAELPTAPELPGHAGSIIAVVGELTPSLRTAQLLAAQLRVPRAAILLAGLSGHPVEGLVASASGSDSETAQRTISGPVEARLLRGDLLSARTPSIVVIATDSIEADPTDRWAREVMQALQPDLAWATVDATRKVADERVRLDQLGSIDALSVHSARLSGSPASTWDLGLPIALLDGRPADTSAWTSLLFGALRTEAAHRAVG
jgi:hypothetical protein